MSLERTSNNVNVIDVLDHVLDKGIVIDAWVRLAVAGIDLVTIEARIVVASIETYVNSAGSLTELARRPAVAPRTSKRRQPVSLARVGKVVQRTR
jgi:gas vesicle structural protein